MITSDLYFERKAQAAVKSAIKSLSLEDDGLILPNSIYPSESFPSFFTYRVN